jgi:hypothetical protein
MLDESKEAKSKRLKAERDARYKAKKKSSQASIGKALRRSKPFDAPLPPIHMPPPIPGFGNITKGLPPRTPEDEVTYSDIPGVTAYDVYDEDEPIIVRQPKVAPPRLPKAPKQPARSARPKPEGMTMVMSRTYQREGKVAGGTAVRGNAKQLSVMFPNKLFDKLAALARKQGISCGEQVRQLVVKLLEDA